MVEGDAPGGSVAVAEPDVVGVVGEADALLDVDRVEVGDADTPADSVGEAGVGLELVRVARAVAVDTAPLGLPERVSEAVADLETEPQNVVDTEAPAPAAESEVVEVVDAVV